MNRFNGTAHTPSAANAGSFHPSLKGDRHDEQGSQSSSDDGYHYADAQKIEADLEDDSNTSLTSQTLNADGTPKRPMNAFMIFARRRRPEVSSENQSMRTGEISKILSREWNSMQPPEKQFYLDQAKQLKETFNTKYPDYVYRRRPNNSRKRRRTDGGVSRPGDTPLQSDVGDDLADLGEPSPIDGDESQLDRPVDVPYSRLPPDTSQSYSSSQSRTSSYPYPSSDLSYHHNGRHENRLPYVPSSQERLSHDVQSTTSLTSSRLSQPPQSSLGYSYPPSQSQTHSSSLYGAEQNDGRGHWESRTDRGRAAPTSWVAGTQDRSAPLVAVSKSQSYSTSQNGTWANSASPVPVSPVSNSGSHPTPNFPFPTLNTPFYPNQTQMPGNYSNTPSSTSSHSSSPSQYNSTSNHVQATPMAGRHGSGYDNRGYAPAPSDSSANPYPSSNRTPHLYQQQPSRQSGLSRGLPTVQSISNYSQPQPPSASGAHVGYWASEKSHG